MRNEEGYTLIELSVALAISGVVVALAYSALSFAGALIVRWQDRVDIESEFHLFSETLSSDMLESTFVHVNESGWTIVTPSGDSTAYTFDEMSVHRGRIRILSGDSVSVVIPAHPANETNSSTRGIRVSVTSDRGYRLTRSVWIRPRHVSSWPVMNAPAD